LAAAIAARKKGFQVTVADGAQPPIDKTCGEGLMPDTLAALRELGVEISASEGYAVRGVRFLGTKSEAVAKFPSGPGIGMRRPVLHAKLVQAAQDCGVSLLWKTPVQGISEEGVAIAGGLVAAKWIIGADGIRSRVRRWSGLDTRTKYERRYAFRQHYRAKPWSDFMEVHWGENAQAYVTPVRADEVCVVLISRHPGMRLLSLHAEFPELARRLNQAADAGRERGATTMMRQLKNVYRGKVALIGDASGSVDAITGEGLCLSFRQAMALAESLGAGDLKEYQNAHRRLARRPTFMGRVMLLLDGHTATRERVMRALASQPDVFARLLAVHVGATSPAHFAATGALLGWRLVAA
jgi:flavin-dependent dehydrogenase